MDLGLAGKTAIITGGGSNVGRGITLGFAQEGFNVETIGKKTLD
jgi:NAD(P)-dependent dehydrogenase (short-subunit alcohol dehydrogenase family)